MDTKNVKKIISLFESSKLSKMDLEIDNIKISMEKGIEEIKYTVPLEYTNKETSLPKENKIDGEPIISPLVGTFYAAPGEGKERFVEVGSNVKKGDILCIIEAMKVMNEIKAIKNGKVTAIQVKNGETVQYGDILMYIV